MESPEYTESKRLRINELRKPIGIQAESFDAEFEGRQVHFVAIRGGEVVGTLCLSHIDERTMQMRQVAVRNDVRREGVGRNLVRAAENYVAAQGYMLLIANARETALDFYRSLGYVISPETFLEVNIPHRQVRKLLDFARAAGDRGPTPSRP